jgi:hypothetical protein
MRDKGTISYDQEPMLCGPLSNLMCFAEGRAPIVIIPSILGNVNRFGPAEPGLNNSVSPSHSLLGWWV